MYAEIVGGPRDGEMFRVPGPAGDPPATIRLYITANGVPVPFHPASHGHPQYADMVLIELVLAPGQLADGNAWRYLWPHNGGGPPARSGPPLL